MAEDFVCIDDCERCPLYKNGCVNGCPRWDDLVCNFCPCLGSKYTDPAAVTTVDPATLEPKPEAPWIKRFRSIRQNLMDGDLITLDMVESTRGTKYAPR